MKKNHRKTYICPQAFVADYIDIIMEVPESLPQGNGDDPVIDDEDDELSKKRDDDWGKLW